MQSRSWTQNQMALVMFATSLTIYKIFTNKKNEKIDFENYCESQEVSKSKSRKTCCLLFFCLIYAKIDTLKRFAAERKTWAISREKPCSADLPNIAFFISLLFVNNHAGWVKNIRKFKNINFNMWIFLYWSSATPPDTHQLIACRLQLTTSPIEGVQRVMSL